MKETYFNSYLEGYSDNEEGNESEFSFIINNLPARERHALETLQITSVDVFCKYDLTELFALRGFGETTVTRLQLLQRELRGEDQEEYSRLTIESPVKSLKLSNKEHNALTLLNIVTIDDLLNFDLSKTGLPRGFGEKTRYLLTQSKKRILQEMSIDLPTLSLEECSVLTMPLNPREKKILVKFHISNWHELACFDFHHIGDVPNIGVGTLQSLLSKQIEVRTKIIHDKIDSHSDFSYDDEYSVFLLDLTPSAKETLWHLSITRISELTKANLNFLKFSGTSLKDTYEELCQIQREFSQMIKDTEIPLNDFLASVPLTSIGISEIAAELLRQNDINSLRDFLFLEIPEEYLALRQVQFELQCQYTPVKFLRFIPSYFNILFYRQKDKTQSNEIGVYLNNFETARDFLSISFEHIVKLTKNNQKMARIIQSIQYELLKSCLDFHQCFDFSVNDEREQSWRQELSEESLYTLPFFGGTHNRNFSGDAFHETFLPGLRLNKVIRGRALQFFLQLGITSLGELLLTTHSHFFLIKRCSKTKITAIQERIRKILFSPPNDPIQSGWSQAKIDQFVFPLQTSPLDKSAPKAFLISLLKRYIRSERTIDIIMHRVGGKTLEKTARVYGVTRERIRQIETKHKNPADFVYAQNIFVEVREMLEKSIVAIGGFASLDKIAIQLAVDNGWSEQDCTPLFAKFLLDRVKDHIINLGHGYYSVKSFPCTKCELLIAKMSSLAKETNQDTIIRNNLFVTLLNTCCPECPDLPRRISEDFLNWKYLSDPLFSQIFSDDEIYRSTNPSLPRMVADVLEKAKHPVSAREMQTYISYRAENNIFTERQVNTAAFNLSIQKKDIFLWDRGGVYAHRKHLPLNSPLLVSIEQKLRQLIKKARTPYISLYTLFGEYQSQCEAEGIPTAFALHACLRARGVLKIAFMRSPYISVTRKKHERRNVAMLENWVAKKKSVISNQSLKHFARQIGLNAQQCYCTYACSKSLIRYEQGRIVHLKSLNWNQAKQESLLVWAKKHWKECLSRGLPCASTTQLLSKYKARLPRLANGIPWTPNLLFSLLQESESVITFGNTYLAYGFKSRGSAPQTFGEVVTETLKRQFGGKAKLSEFSLYLREELQVVRLRLTAGMVRKYPGLVVTKHEIYLAKEKK
ncbi:MAG: hypothetical protein LBC02_04840 [Planctomycetaceae bacterium]|jgi:hypothetical protein|nr:hypothetical protein [Planctomycetaceae bacterium]